MLSLTVDFYGRASPRAASRHRRARAGSANHTLRKQMHENTAAMAGVQGICLRVFAFRRCSQTVLAGACFCVPVRTEPA
eukprot:2524834-Rhodomonas_salina.1